MPLASLKDKILLFWAVMMDDKFQNKYRIPSARLQNWDYASDGAYFITICTKNREHYFGEIVESAPTASLRIPSLPLPPIAPPPINGGFAGIKNPMLHDNISRVIRWYKGRCSFEKR